jgi:response regulator of citrate/malate metabolism
MTPPLKILIVDDDPRILRTGIRTGIFRRLEKPVDLARLTEEPADIEFDQ